jgi:opacity protein-like surface antigen
MKAICAGVFVLALVVTAPGVATAQGRVPHTESTALGVDFGTFRPSADSLENGLAMDVFYEYYFMPRTSLRLAFGWANPEFDGSETSLRQQALRMDLNYNWEGGSWHPFVGAGFGAYFVQQRNNGNDIGETETKPGFNLGGGVEYFLNNNLALKGEGRWHQIPKVRGISPSGFAFTAGVKTYF